MNKVKNAIMLGSVCSVSYFVVYISRNILSTVSPQMIETGRFTTEYIGSLSSFFFAFYAIGQLVNGIIGDRIKARYMMTTGLFMAGICNLFYPFVADYLSISSILYGVTGFFLAMIYAPMTKMVAENLEPIHATRCSLGFEFGALLGSPVAGLAAAIFAWFTAFYASGVLLIAMAVICFLSILHFEKQGIVKYNQYQHASEDKGSIKTLIEHRIIKFTFISVITGVVRTSVVFWLPTYISQYLKFSPEQAANIFTVATLVISLTAFIAVFIYEKLKRNMDLTIFLSFICASVFFIGCYLLKNPLGNIICLVLAIMSSNSAACMLWSRYCPSLYQTGMVSTATGFLDFMSYMAAALASTIFANAVHSIGWGNLILVWFSLMILGILVSIPRKTTLN